MFADPGEETGDEAPAPAREPAPIPAPALGKYYPPPVDGPTLRLPHAPTRLYVDGAYAVSNDLSALPYIAGKGRNLRFAAGGTWRWGRFAFDGELPFINVTTIDVTSVLNQPPTPEDSHQTSVSLGDLRVGATWTTPLTASGALVGGAGLRARLATHTTSFTFQLIDLSYADFSIPYYFRVEPTLILGGALGRFTFAVNQGVNVFLGPDGNFREQHITVPTIYFWDAHYALAWAPWPFLGASVELATDIQLNHVDGVDFAKLNGVRAAWVAPALQVHVGDYRIDAIARIGLTSSFVEKFGLNSGQELLGVLEFVGTTSYTLRVTRSF